MIKRILFWGISLAVLLVIVQWVWNHIEFYEQWVDYGPTREARQNPYLAAEKFLERQGRDVQSFDQLNGIEDLNQYDALYLSQSQQVISDGQLSRLLKWIEKGGSLVVAASPTSMEGRSDRLLEAFGLSVKDSLFYSSYYYYPPQIDADILELSVPSSEITKIKWEDGSHSKLQFNPRFSLIIDDKVYQALPLTTLVDREVSSDIALHWVGFQVGNGRLDVVSDNRLWRSYQIDKFDHAYVLGWLMADASKVGLVYGFQLATWPSLLWRFAPECLALLGFALLFWLWHRGKRFAPAIDVSHRINRSFKEHLLACAQYAWQNEQGDALIKTVRSDLEHLLSIRFAHFQQLSPDERVDFLRQKTGMNKDRLFGAFYGEILTEEEFTYCISTLQKIRKTL